MFKWSELSPEAFEKLCAELLEQSGFTNLKWFGNGGGDKGRDLVVDRIYEPLSGTRRIERWVVQCKRYTRKRLTKTEIEEFLVSSREHAPRSVLIIVTSTLSPDVRDWVEARRKDCPFDILTWEERDLEREIRKYRKHLSSIPEMEPQSKDPVVFYPMSAGEQDYMCNEIEEVGFHVMNSSSPKYDIERIKEFIDFVRHNEVTFEVPDSWDNSDDSG